MIKKVSEFLNPELRAQLSAKWQAQDRPSTVFDAYVVYQYEMSGGPFLVGGDVPTVSNLSKVFEAKGVDHAIVLGEYPYEIYQVWKEKEKHERERELAERKLKKAEKKTAEGADVGEK